jgi:hypothetical protein
LPHGEDFGVLVPASGTFLTVLSWGDIAVALFTVLARFSKNVAILSLRAFFARLIDAFPSIPTWTCSTSIIR